MYTMSLSDLLRIAIIRRSIVAHPPVILYPPDLVCGGRIAPRRLPDTQLAETHPLRMDYDRLECVRKPFTSFLSRIPITSSRSPKTNEE